MDYDSKQYKNFYTLFSKDRVDLSYEIKEGMFRIGDGDDKVALKHNKIPLDIIELGVTWESTKEEIIRRLDNNGEIISKTEILTEVNVAKIWIDNQYIYVFVNKLSLLKNIQEILFEVFGVNSRCLEFTNDFYQKIINGNQIDEIKSISYQTNDKNFSSITISSKKSLVNSDLYNRMDISENKITEITILLHGFSKIKIYKNGKVLLYNLPSIYETFEIVLFIKSLLPFGGSNFE